MKKVKIDVSDILGFCVGLAGVVATIFSAIKTKENGFGMLFIACVATEFIVVLMWSYCLYESYRHHKMEQELNNIITAKEKEVEDTRNEYKAQKDALQKKEDFVLKKLSAISLSIKNNSIHNNELIVKVPSEGDESYEFANLIINSPNLSPEEKKEKILQFFHTYANALYDAFKRYCSDMLLEVIKLESSYLSIKGYNDIKVSATIKLFDQPYIHSVTNPTDIRIYTAFRDKETYSDKTHGGLPNREIGRQLYSIENNNDFNDCLTKDYFFINNVNSKTNNYSNENKEFEKYYNCTVVVPIRTKLATGNKKILGYLCCDCMNSDHKDAEIFDAGAAQYLFAIAQNFATFLETLDANWSDRFKGMTYDGIPKSAIEMIYKRTYNA